jgi:hypothetical protein
MSEQQTASQTAADARHKERPPLLGVGEALDLKEKEATARIISKWLDELFSIPGTNFKIGLDPIINLLPGVGEFLSSSVSLVVILESIRSRVSPSVIFRMMGNMVINAMVGLVPGIGPFLSAFYKSNKRNLTLLTEWQAGEQHRIRTTSRWWVLSWVMLFFAILAAMLLVWAFYFWVIWQMGSKLLSFLGL